MGNTDIATGAEDKVQADMQARLRKLDPGTTRYKVLSAARQFKASWVGLGEHLSAMKAEGGFKSWGYPSFAAYCQKELHIREETARKLTRSYGYLKEHAPAVLRQAPSGAAGDQQDTPSLDVVDLLSQARARTRVSPEAWESLQSEALAGGESPVSRQQVLKRLREVDPENFPVGAKVSAAAKPAVPQDLRKILLLAERLESLLSQHAGIVSDASMSAVARLSKELRQQNGSGTPTDAHGPVAHLRSGDNNAGGALLCPADRMQ